MELINYQTFSKILDPLLNISTAQDMVKPKWNSDLKPKASS